MDKGRDSGRRGGCRDEVDVDVDWVVCAGGDEEANVMGCGRERIRCARTEREPYCVDARRLAIHCCEN